MKDKIMACMEAHTTQLIQAEKQERLPIDVIQAIEKLGFFDLMRPRQYGGLETSYPELLDMIISIASRSGSLAWYLIIMSEHNMVTPLLSPILSDRLFQSQPLLIASSTFTPGKAINQGNHYLLSGHWRYITGIDYCNWVTVKAEITNEDNRKVEFFVPASRFTIHNDWHAIGMRASGSHSASLQNESVPIALCVDKQFRKYTDSSLPLHYRIPHPVLTALGTVAPMIGLLQGMAETLAPAPKNDTISLAHIASLSQLAGLLAETRMLRDSFMNDAIQISAQTQHGNAFTPLYQQQISLRCVLRAKQCRQLASELLACGGTKSVMQDSPLAIKFNDIHVMSTHYLMREANALVNMALTTSPLPPSTNT